MKGTDSMKSVGLITEYNPFHLGHKYHIEKAKELTGADVCIVIMSGNYVQRGTPSFVDKYTKTRVAINNGANIVIELPFCFACSGAWYFAYSAVTILDKLNITDYICFGSEYGDIELLYNIAAILENEPDNFKSYLKNYLKTGISYPAARQKALEDCCNIPDIKNILGSPNNILGIEYIKALIKRNSTIKPVTFKRINAGYHDTDITARLYSATAIRENSNIFHTLNNIDSLYKDTYEKTYPVAPDDFSLLVGESLIDHIRNDTLGDVFGMTNPLKNKITNNIDNYTGFTSFIHRLKSKNLSHTAIARALLHCMLDTKAAQMEIYMNNDICDFIRVLGFDKNHGSILNQISEKSNMHILTQLSQSEKLLENIPPHNKTLLKEWIKADDIYRLTSSVKYKYHSPNEYKHHIIKA